jgi:hypothetical protein
VLRIHGADEVIDGAEAVRRYLESSVHLYDGIPGTKHVVTNLIADVDADHKAATVRSHYTAFQARPELPLQPILVGRWRDRFEHDENEWWLVERLIHADLIGDLRFHIKGLSG